MDCSGGILAAEIVLSPGRPLPLGVHDCCDGFNFALFSRHADRVELLLFDSLTSPSPLMACELDPTRHRTGDIWNALVAGIRWGQAYAYRVHGPWAPEQGHRFDGSVHLLDPYALAVSVTASSHSPGPMDPAPGTPADALGEHDPL